MSKEVFMRADPDFKKRVDNIRHEYGCSEKVATKIIDKALGNQKIMLIKRTVINKKRGIVEAEIKNDKFNFGI